MKKDFKLLAEAYQKVYETKASEDRLDNLAKLHKLGAKMSDAEAAYTVISDIFNKGEQNADDYIALGKELKDGGMGRDEYSIETLQKALEYARQDGWEFDIEAILDQLGGPAGYKQDYEREEHQDDEYRGWPGDGSGEDDFQDYNQNEADHEREDSYEEDDSYNESKSLNEAYTKVLNEANRKPLMPDPALAKFDKRQKSPTSQWKSNPAARGIVVWLKDLKASEEISSDELFDATEGLKAVKAEGGIVIYRAEHYIIVITGND